MNDEIFFNADEFGTIFTIWDLTYLLIALLLLNKFKILFHGNLDGSLSPRVPLLMTLTCYHAVSLLTAFRSASPIEGVHWILWTVPIGKILLTSPIVINVPTRASLAVETKDLLFLWLADLNNNSNVCKQIPSLYWCSSSFIRSCVWFIVLLIWVDMSANRFAQSFASKIHS